MRGKIHGCAMLAMGGAILLADGGPALAKIRCDGPYQIIQGYGAMSTPYCEDHYLAEVAREYGIRASADEIRKNPNSKERLCRFIGDDIRVSSNCGQYLGGGAPSR
jgi:hypothetical protein